MGPQELEDAARQLARTHGADVSSIVGDDLLARELPDDPRRGPRQHRARRGSSTSPGARAPGPRRRVTLVGKGICFDTGGLDIKPASGMLIMKKDMGGAAAALALGHMVMAAGLDVRLRILIPAAENSIVRQRLPPRRRADEPRGQDGGDRQHRCRGPARAGRRAGARRRGAARYAHQLCHADGRRARGAGSGPAAALHRRRRAWRRRLLAAGNRVGDPVWRMPFWSGYEANLDSAVADMNNVVRRRRSPAPSRQRCSCAASSSRPGASCISTSTAGGRRSSRSVPRAASCRPRAPCSRCCAQRAPLRRAERQT